MQKHTKQKVSYLAILLGCLLPDLFTKLPVYGLNIGDMTLIKVAEPWKYHRGWPGVGPTHSLLFIVVIAILLFLAWKKNRAWALGLLLGGFAHVLTDCFDSVGTMLFFPFTTQHYSTGMWAYASQAGRYGDASAYYSSFGGVWDFLWLCIAIGGPKVFTRGYFLSTVVPADPAWGWLKRKFGLNETLMLAVYRAYFVYGGCRIFGWFIWARLLNPERGTQTLDWSWGGPDWVEKAPRTQGADTWLGVLANTAFGVVGVTVSGWLLWRLVGRRLWARAT